ncbi:MAG: ribosomal L7Ae/L30e/S12e/Gadd45 family protein [Lachnospiraceae bacterium]|nr:ribosomal L7Ae/L30e/S12e/Gadd45 family protein [Lachnospiraceae bacterium]
MKQNKVYGLLGLAARGRNLVSGEFATENAIKGGKAMMIVVARDASDNTKKRFMDRCSYYEVPIHIYGTKEELGRAIGTEERSSIALLDEGLAHTITKHLEELQD